MLSNLIHSLCEGIHAVRGPFCTSIFYVLVASLMDALLPGNGPNGVS